MLRSVYDLAAMHIYYVYMLLCADKTFYVGLTSNLERRLYQHNTRVYEGSYTSTRLPVQLIGYEEFPDYFQAKAWESKIKSWRREKKLAFFMNEFEKLPELSKRKKRKRRRSI